MAATPRPPSFQYDPADEGHAEHWLQLLHDGTPDQRAQARTELGLIFERRGQLDEAAEAYYLNVKVGVTDPRPYERLAAIARQRGDDEYAERVLRRLAKVRPTPAAPASAPSPAPLKPARGPHPVRRVPMMLAAAAAGFLVMGVGLLALAVGSVGSSGVAPTPTAAGTAPTVMRQTQPVATPTKAAVNPCWRPEQRFPEWRDPEGAVQQAVAWNYQAKGWNPYRSDPLNNLIRQAYAMPPDDSVAGWMLYSLNVMERGHGIEGLTLADYVERQFNLRSALGSMLRPDYLGAMVTREQWAEMQSWPETTCPGALLRNLDNTRLVRLMTKSVGDTTWLTRSR